MPYGFKLPGTDIVKVPNSGGVADPTKLPLAGGTLSGLLNFSGTTHAGIRLNSLTTTQRNALTAGAGDFLLNTTLNQFQGYVSGAWVSLATLGANTFTSAQTFDATTGAIFPGSTSGNATVKAPAIAGTSVITLPGVTSTLAILGANIFTGAQNITDATASTSSVTGALKVAGGAGIAGKLCVGTLGKSDGTVIFDGNNFISQGANSGIQSSATNLLFGNAVDSYFFTLRAADGLFAPSTGAFGFTDGASYNGTLSSWFKYGGAAAIIQMGSNAASSQISQTFRACGARIGTDTNTTPTNTLTIAGPHNTGTGTGGDLRLGVYGTNGASGTAIGTLNTVLTIVAARKTVNISSIPTSAAGLSSGDVYSNAGILTIV